ncbi:MAG TPA: HEPN family nuclease [Acidobacteriota bacterium]|nr:HEPN family nuclease [Acidobacteriota bacterium]HQM64459.1 HEPN family nuclease [Acidobacteriota bacterium]
MMPGESVPELMRRTMFNLQFIQNHCGRTGPYEVTQLVNSFLGALAHPWEKYQRELTAISLESAYENGWPQVAPLDPFDENPVTLGDLIRLMRNGIAHGNIDFTPDADGEIGLIRIRNIHPRSRRQTWEAILTVKEMEAFLLKFVEQAEALQSAMRGEKS